MKKILIFIFACLLLSGCSKNEKNIVINIYGGNEDKVTNEDIKDDSAKEEIKNNGNNIINTDALDSSYNNEDLSNGESTNNMEPEHTIESNSSIKDESKTDKAKNWYTDNKDELKEISNDIIKEDIDKVKDIISSTKDWYSENKDELKESASEIYNNDKDTLSNLYKKIKNGE